MPTVTGATGSAPGAPPSGVLLITGSKFGRYTIVRPIGAGGMGAVYEATQESPRRSVALKVIRGTWLSAQLLRRFEHESQVLGRLQHPGIAQVYEAGSVKDSHGETVPFFAMELIKGIPLTEYAAAKNLGTRERLELVARICDAVYHAHQKGVIHRDLKPGNILVDESGQPKILDFGVARATDSDIQQTTMQTDIGQLIGTVPYMSPEQVSGDPNDLDTRSDVYALGVISYELLAGRLPYDLQKKMIHEAVRVIREEDPTRLSSINRTLRGDIETIVAKALEKDKQRRYQSAEALGSDIRRYLKDEPIAARPASTWYQAAKFARRNKVLVGGVAATFAVLLAGIIGVSLMLQRALAAESDLTEQIGHTNAALTKAQESEGEATAAKNDAIKQRDAAEYEAYVAHLTAADASFLNEMPAQVRESLDACPQRLRGWEWRYLNALSDTSAATVRGGGQLVQSVDLSPDGKHFAYLHGHASIAVHSTATTEQVASFAVGPLALAALTFSPDSSRLLVRGLFSELFLYDPMTGTRITEFTAGGLQHYIARFSPDGRRIAVGFKDGCARIMDCAGGEELVRLDGHTREVTRVAFSPDGAKLLTGSRDGALRLWHADGRLIGELSTDHKEVLCVEFSPVGALAMSAGRDGKVRIWNVDAGTLIAAMPMKDFPVFCCAFSPDGSWCAAGDQLGNVVVWEAATGALVARMEGYNQTEGHKDTVSTVRFGKDRERLLTASNDKTARIWETRTGRQLVVLRGHTDSLLGAFIAPNSGPILTFASDGNIKLWRLAFARGEIILRGHEHVVLDAAFTRDGRRIGTASLDSTARIWDAATGACTATYKHARRTDSVSFTPDGRSMLVGSVIGPAALIDADTAAPIRSFGADDGGHSFAMLNPGGDRVLCGSSESGMTAYDTATGAALYTVGAGTMRFEVAAFSPDGSRIATLVTDGRLDQWNAADGSLIPGPREGNGPIGCLAYSPDGRTIAIGNLDGEIFLRDSETGLIRVRRRAHDDRIVGINYSPDGTRLVTASYDRTARVWDSATLRTMATIRAHTVWVNSARFSPDGERILTAASDATARVHDSVPVRVRWPVKPPDKP